MRQKVMALLLALVLAFGGLTACGGDADGEDGATPNGQTEGGDDGGDEGEEDD